LVSPRYSTWTMGESPWATILKGHDWMSFLTVSSSKRRPMRRLKRSAKCSCAISDKRNTHLTSKTVFSGFIAAWFLAASPMRRSSLVNETNEGVVKLPCSLATGSKVVRR
jgi:hypothetical protein